MVARWRSFGWQAEEIDGHDVAALAAMLDAVTPVEGPPRVLVARTTFGKGVSYMENQLKWHYWPMSDDEYRQALAELDAG
jgi:transketolase